MSSLAPVRGEVVIVDFSATYPNARTRPALIVQNDRDNARMNNTIVVQITSNISRAHEPTQLLLTPAHPHWAASGLRLPSVVNCSAIGHINASDIRRSIGVLSAETMLDVNRCLKVALGIV